MHDWLNYVILGLGTGAIYALAAQGVVLIYRGSGTINFAHGAMALLGAATFIELRDDIGFHGLSAAAIGVGITALVGWLIDAGIMRRIRRTSPLTRLVATLGVLGVVEGVVIIRYGSSLRFVEPIFFGAGVALPGGFAIGLGHLILFLIAIVVAVLFWWF